MTLRDELATTRTVMANQRTLLAYARTGMTFIIAGAGALKFIEDGVMILLTGWGLIGLGILFFVFGWRNYLKFEKSLFRLCDKLVI